MVKSSVKPTAKRSWRATPQFSTLTQKYAATILAPLRRGEAAAAKKLALAAVVRDETIRAERTRIYEPMLRIEKPKRRGGPPARIVWVRVRDRDRGLVHEISVATGKIIEHVVNEHANPPFSDKEREDARHAISTDTVLGRLVKQKDVGIEWFSPGSHTAGRGRAIGARLVRLKNNRVIETLADTEVNLDQEAVHEPRARQ